MPTPTAPSANKPSRVARLADVLLGLGDTPERTAAAFALGVFFSFSPFLGLQILLSMAVAVACRLNRVAVFVGLNANLPWLLVPWYGGTTLLAARLLGAPVPVDPWAVAGQLAEKGWSAAAFGEAASLVAPVAVPFVVGPTIGAAIVGLATFALARPALVRRATGAAVTA